MNPEQRLGPAATRWSDFTGTAAADGAEVVQGRPSLYELAGLDRERWLVTGLDIEVASGQLGAVVYAFDRSAHPDHQVPYEVDAVLAEHGYLPVKAIHLSEATQIQPLLEQVFERVAIRLVARDFRDDTVVVEAAEE